ncbi:hypothetical protein K501DRAFT_225568 [Backusella circina FSU 941]|nr:hypothetical protein K501DRAFT_225568 [Backusella circina FSU 941]
MIVITGNQRIGTLLPGCDILRATNFQILPIPRNTADKLSRKQLEDEQSYIHLLKNHLKQNAFYYSYKYDVTLSVQKQAELGQPDFNWRNSDDRFFWNKSLCQKLITACSIQDISSFILPVIQGFVSIYPVVISNRSATFALISRRSQERAGTRYFSRGLDEFGRASNFVETEQLVCCDPSKSLIQNNSIRLSYIQTRGSVPAIWKQIPNTRYTPRLWLNTNLEDERVMGASKLHFDEQIKRYGDQILVNLVNTKGYENPVGQLYARIVKELNNPQLRYIHFDFHHECRKMKWNRVQLLVDQLEPELRKQEYCYLDMTNPSTPVLNKMQTSVVRTNCMDCLDRTNVVQSTIARWVLNRQLREVGILQSTEVIENDEQFMQIFKTVWADNADGLSIPYSGTGALKTDYTRTGRRTRLGLVNDFNNSAMRYIKNNYMDGSRQDGIDLILGKFKVLPSMYNRYSSPFQTTTKNVFIKSVPIGFILFLVLFIFILFFPDVFSISQSLTWIFALSFTFAISITCWLFIQQNGQEFVDWPKLVPYDIPDENEQQQQGVTVDKSSSMGITSVISRWTDRRNSTAILNEAEEGYELPRMKKTT